MVKNSKKTTRRAASAICRIFGEVDKPIKTYTIEDKFNIDAGKNVLAMFKLGISYFE